MNISDFYGFFGKQYSPCNSKKYDANHLVLVDHFARYFSCRNPHVQASQAPPKFPPNIKNQLQGVSTPIQLGHHMGRPPQFSHESQVVFFLAHHKTQNFRQILKLKKPIHLVVNHFAPQPSGFGFNDLIEHLEATNDSPLESRNRKGWIRFLLYRFHMVPGP